MNAPGERTLTVGHGLFHPISGELSLDGRTVKLRPRAAALLSHLVQHSDRVVGKDELMQAVWPDVVVTEDSLVQCVKEIRQALGNGGREWIRTAPRQGYAFVGNALQDQPKPVRWPRFATLGLIVATVAIIGVAVGMRFWPEPAPQATAAPWSIAVLPIANLTGDATREKAADELTEAIIDVLGRGRGPVIALSTAFTYKGKTVDVRSVGAELKVRYVLQGALRMDGAQPVLTMRLSDAASGVQLWRQEFPAGTGGVPILREDVLGGLISALGQQLIRAEAQRSGRPDVLEAAELVSRARALMRQPRTAETMLQARALLEQAVRLDDNVGTTWVYLAGIYLHDVRFSPTRTQDLKRASEAIERAVKLIPNSDGIRLVQARVQYEQGRIAQALQLVDGAIELNPANAAAFGFRGLVLIMMGRPQEAFAPIEQAMRLSPNDPQLPAWQIYRGLVHLQLGQDAQAVEWLTRAQQAVPTDPLANLFLAGALGISGRSEEARSHLAQFQQLRPGVTLGRFRALEPSQAPAFRQQRERLYEGLRRAGMPE